jgi:hypothetical protein
MARFGVVAGLFLLAAELMVGLLQPEGRIKEAIAGGGDFLTYITAARSWLEGGPFYHPYQVTGPYQVVYAEILYPPPVLLLLVPFTVLPAILWWAIPIATTTYFVAQTKPRGWRLAAILFLLAVPYSLDIVATGNPALWMLMFGAIAIRIPGMAALILLKPTLALFAFVGIRSRLWWGLTAGLILVSVLLLPLTREYVTVVLNAQWPGGNPLYSLNGVPLMLIPIVANLPNMTRAATARRDAMRLRGSPLGRSGHVPVKGADRQARPGQPASPPGGTQGP